EAIREANLDLADPRRLDADADVDALINDQPAIAWMAYNIHGDEMSGCDAGMIAAYYLAAGTDAQAKRFRDELVVHFVPMQNPDGRERFLAQVQTMLGQVHNPDVESLHFYGDWTGGRWNHYMFDLNRDWLPMTQPETRGHAAAILRWQPHMLIDGHEMGALSSFLFEPPREPLSPYSAPINLEWRRKFGREHAKAFDVHGWSYYSQDWYEEWYIGYTNAWANLLGAVGILYEQASITETGVIKRAGDIETYQDSVHHQYVSTIANLDSLVRHRTKVIRDFHEDRRWAVEGRDEHRGVFLLPPHADGSRRARFLDVLLRQEIEFTVAEAPFQASVVRHADGTNADAARYPAGTVVIRSEQPHRRLLHAMLAFDPRMSDDFLVKERSELEKRGSSLMYDVSSWNLPMSYGLPASWADAIEDVETSPYVEPDPGDVTIDDAAYGYMISSHDSDVQRAAVELLNCDIKVRANTKPMQMNGTVYPVGCLLIRGHEQTGDWRDRLTDALDGLAVRADAMQTALSENGWDLGGTKVTLLDRPRVALLAQYPVSQTDFGAVWHALDARLGIQTTLLIMPYLNSVDLRRYNVLIVPNSSGMSQAMTSALRSRLIDWVSAGGTLIMMDSAAGYALLESSGMSSVRRRRDVLEDMPVYAEWIARERGARAVAIDPALVWDDPVETNADDAADEAGAVDDAEAETAMDADARKRLDAWRRRFSPSGVFVRAEVDQEHWINAGVDASLSALWRGSTVHMSKPPVETAVRLAPTASVRLSGLLWPEARERIGDSAYVTVESRGYGQIILFAHNPVFRGYQEGTGRVFGNAVIYGPGLGATPALPPR
ncbi:MAG: M14 family zinc carboxypeptidase, partial [Planctomycetota bacterium]